MIILLRDDNVVYAVTTHTHTHKNRHTSMWQDDIALGSSFAKVCVGQSFRDWRALCNLRMVEETRRWRDGPGLADTLETKAKHIHTDVYTHTYTHTHLLETHNTWTSLTYETFQTINIKSKALDNSPQTERTIGHLLHGAVPYGTQKQTCQQTTNKHKTNVSICKNSYAYANRGGQSPPLTSVVSHTPLSSPQPMHPLAN